MNPLNNLASNSNYINSFKKQPLATRSAGIVDVRRRHRSSLETTLMQQLLNNQPPATTNNFIDGVCAYVTPSMLTFNMRRAGKCSRLPRVLLRRWN